jgi:hypothetical protein
MYIKVLYKGNLTIYPLNILYKHYILKKTFWKLIIVNINIKNVTLKNIVKNINKSIV